MFFATIIENPTQVKYAVIKNDKYHSDMDEVEVLPDSWHPLPLIED